MSGSMIYYRQNFTTIARYVHRLKTVATGLSCVSNNPFQVSLSSCLLSCMFFDTQSLLAFPPLPYVDNHRLSTYSGIGQGFGVMLYSAVVA